MNVVLAVLDTGLPVRDWTDAALRCDAEDLFCDDETVDCAALFKIVARTLDADIQFVRSVTQDGTPLVFAADEATLRATAGSWRFDVVTRQLRVHLLASGPDAVADVALVVVAPVLLARGRTITKAMATPEAPWPLTWDGRIAGLPTISQQAAPDELGAGALATFGELTILNEDGVFDRVLSERIVNGHEARLYYGDADAPFSALGLYLRGLMRQPSAGAGRCAVPLLSLGALLQESAITRSFQVTEFPAMDPAIAGFHIPIAVGTGVGRLAFRIASGVWKWSDRPTTSITEVLTQDGTAVEVLSVDHATGTFTVDPALDTEFRLYVTGRGVPLDYAGEQMAWVLEELVGLTSADYDGAALARMDEERPAKVEFQVATGSRQELLDLIARSAFVDYTVDRTNVFSARVRRRDHGNYVENDDFEVDAAGWDGQGGATISRTTARRFRGTGALQIVKPATSPFAYARVPNLALKANTFYVVTLLAALMSGQTTTCRLSLTDSDGHEYFSEDITLRADRWTRITVPTLVPITNAVIFCASESVFCDSEVYSCATEGGDLRIYPQFGGADDVTIVIDDVDLAEALVLDDTNAEYVDSAPQDPTIWRARPRYAVDGRVLESGRFGNAQNEAIRRLVKTAESRQLSGQLVDAADAALVAPAVLDALGTGRTRATYRVLDPDALGIVDVARAQVLYLATTRRPSVPGDGRLFRLAGLEEARPEDGGPDITIEADALYDPVFDPMAIQAA